MKCEVARERWAFRTPFRITRGVMTHLDVITVRLTNAAGVTGWAEAAGVDYDGETIDSIVGQIDAVTPSLVDGLSRTELLGMLPPGGARNAIDCALWDLEAKVSGVPAWQTAGLGALTPMTTAITIGIGSPDEVRQKARALMGWPVIKIKADGMSHVEPVRLIHEICPDARFIVDANQGWDVQLLNTIAPELASLNVALIEQPVAKGADAQLSAYTGTIPLAADESCVDRASLPGLLGLYQFVNIKLDKTGGLTEALALAAEARSHGLGLMVGCMAGTSLAMAPAAIIAQQSQFVDLDGPLLHAADRPQAIEYGRGTMSFPTSELWG